MPTPDRTSVGPWRWVGRSLAIGAALLTLGWAVGLAGALGRPWIGMLAGVLGVLFGGGAWAMEWIGATGLGAGFVGFVAALGMSIEGHHAVFAATVPIAEVGSLAAWDPRGDIKAFRTRELRHLRKAETWASQRHGSGKTASTTTTLVTPLIDPAEQRVVGFHCASANGPRRGDGSWVLDSAEWSGSGPVECSAGVRMALDKCAAAHVAVAPGADQRFVEVFASEQELRGAHNLRMVVAVPMGFFLLYAVFAVAFRRRGAASIAQRPPA